MRTEPKRPSAVPQEPMPPELQAKMIAAFERARAERLAAQIPEEGVHWASDPRIRANTAAFLMLEHERRAVAARLSRPHRRRGDRYRDLILVTKLIRVEYEHLAGRAGEAPGNPSPTNGLRVGGDLPAAWARPWGTGPLVEMDTALAFYQDQRDRLARWLPAASRGSAAAAADGQRDRILSRFERARSGRGLWLEQPSESESQRRWRWASLPFEAAAVAVVFAAIGVGGLLAGNRGGESHAVSAPSRAVVAVPAALAAVNERPRQPQPARSAGDESKALGHKVRRVEQTAPVASESPPAAHERVPVPEVASAPVAAPAPPPPPPPAPAPQPDPNPQPDPKPGPGPVSSLPPPVGSLPPPDGSGGGG